VTRGSDDVKAKLQRFGLLVIAGSEYPHDVVIDAGRIRKRKKKPSKAYRERFGHTPLSVDEALPWGGDRLIVGTGAFGSLPVMPEVYEEAANRGVKVIALPTAEACRRLARIDAKKVHAVLHCTC
jgi:hypothetical protein